ncbi:enoyl-CoA hydratase/isomerase family protein [Propionibacteriaceae bacterium Y1700]|uniref:enoyl-CoA hydratase/isomerase family protein n=1 Tax=Microlunatus sp. Y1700 TaxID=3418487 RepID=UPI003DA6FAE5
MSVRIDRHDHHIAELVMDRPEAMNAISTDQAARIAEATAELAADDTVRVVLLSSAVAKAFCVGADLKERAGFTEDDFWEQRRTTSTAYGGVLGLPMPAIALVEGHALGGGFELALSCDLIVASPQATFGLPEVGVGVIPGGGGTQLLTRRLGYNAAADLILTARRLTAEEAFAAGVVDRLATDRPARDVALELAQRIAGHSPIGTRNAKIAMRHGLDLPLAEGLAIEERAWRTTVSSADRLEGIAAFNEKRPPNW